MVQFRLPKRRTRKDSGAAQVNGPAERSRDGVVTLVRLLLPHCAVKLENGADAAFEDLTDHAVLFVLAAAQFAFDLHVSSLLQGGREIRNLAVGHATVPFGSG